MVKEHAPKDVQGIIRPLVEAVDAQDSGKPITYLIPNISNEAKEIFGMTGIGQVFRSIQTMCHYICYGNVTNEENAEMVFNEMVYTKMKFVFSGFLKGGHIRSNLREPLSNLIQKFAKKYPSKEDEEALAPLLKFQDQNMDVYRCLAPRVSGEVWEILRYSGIIGVYGAVRSACDDNDKKIEETMFLIFNGMRLNGITMKKNAIIATVADYFCNDKIAIARDLPRGSLYHILKKVRILIYIDGMIIGVKRGSNEQTMRMDHPALLELIKSYGESDSWYCHPNGYKCGHGGSRNPPKNFSAIPIEKILKAAMIIITDDEKTR